MRFYYILLFLLSLIPTNAFPATYQVGPERTYTNLQAVAPLLQPGDLVEVDGDAAYPGNVVFENAGAPENRITIRGIRINGNRPLISGGTNTVQFSTPWPYTGPGGDYYVFEGFEITGGAERGIFHQANDIIIRDVAVHDCPRQGILGADQGSGSLTLEYVEVHHCGEGDRRHQIYMATDEIHYPGSVFRMRHCYIHDGNGGNNVKSRAERNEIYYNWIEGAYYHEIELIGPDGGDGGNPALAREDSDIVGNVFRKTGDFYVARTGGDGTGETNGRYRFVNNIFICGDPAVFRLFDGMESIEMHNNVFVHRSGGVVDIFRNAEVDWSTGTELIAGSNNWVSENAIHLPTQWTGTLVGTAPGFLDFAGLDYRPGSGSPLIDSGNPSPSGPPGYPFPSPLMLPALHPPPGAQIEAMGSAEPRPVDAVIDIGAYEYPSAAPVAQPELLHQIQWTGTSWFGSPIIHDLGTGEPKLIGTYYDIIVWDKNFNEIARAPSGNSNPHEGRIYPPAVCADLDQDGIFEIIVASNNGKVAAYEWRNDSLSVKSGWPASACDAGQCPEVRGIAAGDLNADGAIEIVVTTTQTNGGAQVFAFNPDGSLYQPPGLSYNAWPRYNTETGPGNDADANGPGNHGYGCYGLNVGIGNLNDDPNLEIVVTFDNHQINVFYHDGVSMLASDYFTNRSATYYGNRLNWGQFIRWFDPVVEENHYHLHTGDWPHPDNQKWMQWTQSPPSVADMNGDGKNEVVCVANVEMDTPYDTKHHSIMVLEGSYGDGSRSARRLSGWENLPSSDYPLSREGHTWYPPTNPPAPTIVDLTGDSRPEILYAAHDGYIYCTSPDAARLWRTDFRHGRALMYASEIMVADLNQDQVPELILTTFGDPESIVPGQAHGYLMILNRDGGILHDMELPQQGTNGNGKGAPAAPTVMDLNGDGNLEIIVQTFGAGCFIYTVPGSAENLLLWPTGRGNYLRDGRPWTNLEQTEIPGDIDSNGTVDLADAIMGFQVVTGVETGPVSGDVNRDGRIGLAEVVYILQVVTEIR